MINLGSLCLKTNFIFMKQTTPSLKYLKQDLPAGFVVFLVALPLCLGVALASGAPLFAGVIAGIVGGIVVGILSGSQIGVSGPAAGLTVIVLTAIQEIGSFPGFLMAVVLAGIFQILFSILKAGKIAFYFPSSVIKGMLAAIGIIIIMKQIPHLLGLDKDFEGDFAFFQSDGENTFSEFLKIFDFFTAGAVIIGLFSVAIILFWESKFIKKIESLKFVPGALVAVLGGTILNIFLPENLVLQSEHLVSLPVSNTLSEFKNLFTFPDVSYISNKLVIKTGFVLAAIASLETLLCVEATDKIDPEKRITPTNRELFAQGVGNICSGLIGGLPLTQVVVRSSANIQSGNKTKLSAIIHGVILLLSAIFIPTLLNKIPLATLAAILILVGYKLTKISIFKQMKEAGNSQFVPFVITILAIVFTDLLTGVVVGLFVGIAFILIYDFKGAVSTYRENNNLLIFFNKDIYFFNRAEVMSALEKIEEGDVVFINGNTADFIDQDIFITLQEFAENAKERNLIITLDGISPNKQQLT